MLIGISAKYLFDGIFITSKYFNKNSIDKKLTPINTEQTADVENKGISLSFILSV